MLFSEKLKRFTAAHPSANLTVGGAQFRYVLSGRENGRPLVFLNDGLSEDYRVLLFDYPQQLRTNQALVAGMHAFFRALGI